MKVLLIDDDPGIRRSIAAYLEDLDFAVLHAENGRQGLSLMKEYGQSIELAIVDLRMPVMDGYEFISECRLIDEELPIIVLSGVGIVDEAMRAMRLGAWDFVTKPIHDMEMLYLVIQRAQERLQLLQDNRLYRNQLELLVAKRTAQLEDSRRQLMRRLSRAAEYKDNETGRHVIRVGEMTARLASAIGLSDSECELLRDCAPLHDIGKIGIPDVILLKEGPLNEDEWEIMRCHCIYGAEILGPLAQRGRPEDHHESLQEILEDESDNELLRMARILALCHHERWDGTGYPNGLKGTSIPLPSRILSVIDVYDALASRRPYKNANTEAECVSALREGSGTQFDPAVVEAFLENHDALRAIRSEWSDEKPVGTISLS